MDHGLESGNPTAERKGFQKNIQRLGIGVGIDPPDKMAPVGDAKILKGRDDVFRLRPTGPKIMGVRIARQQPAHDHQKMQVS